MQLSLDKAYTHCAQVTREGAKNFYYAFITLPRAKRNAIYATYTFCRLCDDVADDVLPIEEKRARLLHLKERLHEAFKGCPDDLVFLALRDTADRFTLPQDYFYEVLAGVEMDLTQHRYTSFTDLETYCYRVASVVGLICVEIFQYDDPKAKQHAIDLGLAMQLTNIIRDVKEDADRGRIYIPKEEIQRFGYTEDDLLNHTFNANFVKLMQFQVDRARRYFNSGPLLVPLLSRRSRACPKVLHGLYSRVLDHVEKQGFNVFERKIHLTSREKILLTTKLWIQSFLPQDKNQPT